jgi:hypothetical protein
VSPADARLDNETYRDSFATTTTTHGQVWKYSTHPAVCQSARQTFTMKALKYTELFEEGASTWFPSWKSLDEDKQAMFGFLIWKNQIERRLLLMSENKNSMDVITMNRIWNALNKTTEQGERLFSFVRKEEGNDVL